MWLGGPEANPAGEDGNWIWDMSGISVNDSLFDHAHDQPDNLGGDQDYICLYAGRNGFDDVEQDAELIFLCETEYFLC